MRRVFDVGRQSEALLNEEHHKLYKAMEKYLEPPNPANPNAGPIAKDPVNDPIMNKAMWVDDYTDPTSADLKYYNNGKWNIFFQNKFKITDQITSIDEPMDAVQGQLWINNMGVMHYYDKGIFVPIKAVQADIGDINIQQFEDFLIISPLELAGDRIVDNFSELLFAQTPITDWEASKLYAKHQGCVYDLHIYMANKEHASISEADLKNKELWTRLDFLNQYLVPNINETKLFIDGAYVHQKMGFADDPNETGYEATSNVCATFPVEMIENKFVSGVHISPKRLHNIQKKVFIIDKENPIIEMQEENTEFYVIQDGIGRLLVKTDSDVTTDYISITSNNTDCIKLSPRVAEKHEFIYCVHYEFTMEVTKQKGKLFKKKHKLKDETFIWVGTVDPTRLAVFAQGLYYENHPENYIYNAETGYITIKEKIQDSDYIKHYDFSVLSMPDVHQGKVTNNFHPEYGYRINLSREPISNKYIAFCGGIQLSAATLEVMEDPNGNPRVKYIPSLTKDIFDQNDENMYWSILGTNELDTNGNIELEMLRGNVKVVNRDGIGNVINIYRDKTKPVANAIYLNQKEKPLLFTDGVLSFQKEIEIKNDYIKIYGLQVGQEVTVLADTYDVSEEGMFDEDIHVNSDRLLFEDVVSFSTIPTEHVDDHIVYLQNGIICDASATYTSVKPKTMGYHGEVRFLVNHSQESWICFNRHTHMWETITNDVVFTDPLSGRQTVLTEYLDENLKGYSSTKNSITFLQKFPEQYCTYYGYRYTDSIERKLQMDYIYPNGKDGINVIYPEKDGPKPYEVHYKHGYIPGKNELTVYLNGVRQNLASPYDIGFTNSTARESTLDKNNNFVLAEENGTNEGLALPLREGYYTYILSKNEKEDIINSKTELTKEQILEYENKGYYIRLLESPKVNTIFYVIEPCESGESKACDRILLTHEDSNANRGAFIDNSYDTGNFVLTRGNIRVFINGIRQPFGGYQTLEAADEHNRKTLYAYKILDYKTIKFESILTGGMGGNEGTAEEPLYPIGEITNPDGTTKMVYRQQLDEIVIEMRRDYKLREITIPIKDNTAEFSVSDGIPADMFKTKDKVMIYINGLAYGKNYKIENQTIKLIDEGINRILGTSNKDVITFEWR